MIPSAISGCAPALPPHVIERLADADAFGSLGLSRRQALWAAKALGRVGDRTTICRCFATMRRQRRCRLLLPSEPEVALPPMPPGEDVVNDYRFLGCR